MVISSWTNTTFYMQSLVNINHLVVWASHCLYCPSKPEKDRDRVQNTSIENTMWRGHAKSYPGGKMNLQWEMAAS